MMISKIIVEFDDMDGFCAKVEKKNANANSNDFLIIIKAKPSNCSDVDSSSKEMFHYDTC